MPPRDPLGVPRVTPRRTARRDALVLSGATALSGLAAYAFVALGTRKVGAEDFAPVSILWTFWAVSAATFTFPVQHWIIRTMEASGEPAVWATLPRIWRMTFLTSILIGGAATALSPRLFGVSGIAFPLMTALLPLASVLMGLNRGVLAGRSRFASTAGAILGENVIRVVMVLVVGSRWGAEGLGWSLMMGFAVAVFFPQSFIRRDGHSQPRQSVSLLGGLAGANAAAQVVLTAGPVVLSLLGGADRLVTELFAVLAVLRAPYTLMLGTSTRVTAPLTRLARSHDREAFLGAQRMLALAAVGVVLLSPVVALIVPTVAGAVFGLTISLSGLVVTLLVVGSLLALFSLLQMLVLLADGRSRLLMASWGGALVLAGPMLVLPTDPVTRVAVAFAVAEVVAVTVMIGGSFSVREYRLADSRATSTEQDR